MNILDETLMKEADLMTALARHNFFENECKECYKKKKIKKRDCDLLYGYKKPCCKLMDNFVEEKTKKINEKILKKVFNYQWVWNIKKICDYSDKRWNSKRDI